MDGEDIIFERKRPNDQPTVSKVESKYTSRCSTEKNYETIPGNISLRILLLKKCSRRLAEKSIISFKRVTSIELSLLF